jgi:hypothetical protein
LKGTGLGRGKEVTDMDELVGEIQKNAMERKQHIDMIHDSVFRRLPALSR